MFFKYFERCTSARLLYTVYLHQGPVDQYSVSLTSSLRGTIVTKLLTTPLSYFKELLVQSSIVHAHCNFIFVFHHLAALEISPYNIHSADYILILVL